MFTTIYNILRGATVADLIQRERFGTLHFLHRYLGLDVVYASSSRGTLYERVDRFLMLQQQGYNSPEDKSQFMQGLLIPHNCEPNILYETLRSRRPARYGFINLFDELTRSKCFEVEFRDEVVAFFLYALFAQNSDEKSAFSYILTDTNAFNELFKLLDSLDCFKIEHHKEAIREAISVNESNLREMAIKGIDSFEAMRKFMVRAGYKHSRTPPYLTSLERVLFLLMPNNFENSLNSLRQMKYDGATLTKEQADELNLLLALRKLRQPHLLVHWKHVEIYVKYFKIKSGESKIQNIETGNRAVLKPRKIELVPESNIENEQYKKTFIAKPKSKSIKAASYRLHKSGIFPIKETKQYRFDNNNTRNNLSSLI